MPRIISLIASATEIIHALGMGEYLVGRSHECDFPPSVESLPVCTAPRFLVSGSSQEIDGKVKETLREAISVYQVYDHVLESLQPTHIITQSQCEVCAVSLRDVELALASSVSSKPRIVSLQPNSLSDVWSDIYHVGEALGVASQAERLIKTLRLRMQTISSCALSSGNRLRVACLEWLEPLMAAGNWMPELVEMAGSVRLFGETGKHSQWMSWEQVLEQDPEVVVAMPCGFDMKKTEEEMYWLTQRSEWPSLAAVKAQRVYVVDGNQYFNRPGPRLVESLQILAEILHPTKFEPVLLGVGWRNLTANGYPSAARSAIDCRTGEV